MALRTSFWTCSWRGRNRFMDVITASTSPWSSCSERAAAHCFASLHHHPGGLSQTATHRLRIDPPTEGLGGLNGAHVGRGVFVPQGISLVVLFGLGE